MRREFLEGADRDLEGAAGATALLAGMADALTLMGDDLRDLDELPPEELSGLLEGHSRLLAVITGQTEADESTA